MLTLKSEESTQHAVLSRVEQHWFSLCSHWPCTHHLTLDMFLNMQKQKYAETATSASRARNTQQRAVHDASRLPYTVTQKQDTDTNHNNRGNWPRFQEIHVDVSHIIRMIRVR